MTKNQIQQFNKMRNALIRINKGYMTPDQIRRCTDKEYGLSYEDSLEMAYENLQSEAKEAVKGVRELTDKTAPANRDK